MGIREGRRINGYYCITREDLAAGKRVEHPVAMGSFPIDIHSPKGNSMEYQLLNKGYQIPWESLVSKDLDNLLVGGRCICCTHEALGSVRITATAMATGMAAGVGAALVCGQKAKCIELEYHLLVRELKKMDAILSREVD